MLRISLEAFKKPTGPKKKIAIPSLSAYIIIRAAPPISECPMFPVGSAKEREILEAHLMTRSYIKG